MVPFGSLIYSLVCMSERSKLLLLLDAETRFLRLGPGSSTSSDADDMSDHELIVMTGAILELVDMVLDDEPVMCSDGSVVGRTDDV